LLTIKRVKGTRTLSIIEESNQLTLKSAQCIRVQKITKTLSSTKTNWSNSPKRNKSATLDGKATTITSKISQTMAHRKNSLLAVAKKSSRNLRIPSR